MQQRKILVQQQNDATTTVETKPATTELAGTIATIVSLRSRSRGGIGMQHKKKTNVTKKKYFCNNKTMLLQIEFVETLATNASLKFRGELRSRGGGGGGGGGRGGRGEGELRFRQGGGGGRVRSIKGLTYLAGSYAIAIISSGMEVTEEKREAGRREGGMVRLAGSCRRHPPLPVP
jgi:hypothetical protein